MALKNAGLFSSVLFFGLIWVGGRTATANVSDVCKTYTDCDDIVACEIYRATDEAPDFETFVAPDYDAVLADVAAAVPRCAMSNASDVASPVVDGPVAGSVVVATPDAAPEKTDDTVEPDTDVVATTAPDTDDDASADWGDNSVHNGPCTTPAYSEYWTNTIITTGKYAEIDPAFHKAMTVLFRKEGKCVNHPNDPGGYTCYGVSQRAHPDVDVSKLTPGKVEDFAYKRFYKAFKLDLLSDSIRGDVFLAAWTHNPMRAIRHLQGILGVPETGMVDQVTITAVDNYVGNLHEEYIEVQRQYFTSLARRRPSSKVFLKGWLKGIELYRENGCHVVAARTIEK